MATYVLGPLAAKNVPDRLMGNAIFPGDCAPRHALSGGGSYIWQFLVSDFGIPMGIAAIFIRAASAFSYFVVRVLFMGAIEQMTWVAADGIVAFVTGAMIRHAAIGEKPCGTRGANDLAFIADMSISTAIKAGFPGPALIDSAHVYLWPKALSEWNRSTATYWHALSLVDGGVK